MLKAIHILTTTRFSRAARGALFSAALLGSATGGQVPAAARPPLSDSSVSALMRLARRGSFPDAAAIEILRQLTQSYPETKRRALADSITSLAINLSGAAITAVGVIRQSGNADPRLGGQADPSALNHLIRIGREARDIETRMGAIRGMAFQVDPARALPYLKEAAASPRDGEALMAVAELSRMAFSNHIGSPRDRAAAATALRELYDGGEMKSGGAITDLCQIAASQRWPAKPMCRGRA